MKEITIEYLKKLKDEDTFDYIKDGWLDNLDEQFTTIKYKYKKKVDGKIKELKSNICECINNCKSPTGKNKDEKLKAIFRAFSLFPMNETRILILGQDPYPESHKAEGLAFSVQKNYPKIDASLANIFKAVDEYAGNKKRSQSLIDWAKTNKVLLLNTALTYEEKSQKSKHQAVWNPFVKKIIIDLITNNYGKLVVFLWGEDAQKLFFECTNSFGINNCTYNYANAYTDKRETKIITRKLLCLTTSHPSPRSAWRGFKDDAPEHFRTCDEFLGKIIDKNKQEKFTWLDFPENN